MWLPGQNHWPKGMGFDRNETTLEEWRAWAANDLVIPWTESMINLRLPAEEYDTKKPIELRDVEVEKGWLGDIETGILASYQRYISNKSTASWFPDKRIAGAWARFVFK